MTAPDDPFRSPTPGTPPPSQPYGGQPYGGQPYGGQPYGGPAFGEQRPAPRNGLGTAALVLGVLGLLTGLFVVGGVLGVVAVVLGVLGRARAGRGQATNGGTAVAGIVLGVLAVLLSVLVVAGAVSFFDEFSNLTECLEGAAGDPAAEQQCQTDFEDDVVS